MLVAFNIMRFNHRRFQPPHFPNERPLGGYPLVEKAEEVRYLALLGEGRKMK